ncbi:alpha/beta fold hydrolase [Chitinophaga sp. GCM10012297]|uniref:Alpha/beta hydrolase n=1 Tax=Chitinophaga chungangae TaxID=2821488 RepID=A0ABS3YF50_9BACT|nr:alpha/beta hydrolase [Chitinophaga chungangae]MBO9153298.1 alpha/beta hydrolase [Chitinophaga chungangae]
MKWIIIIATGILLSFNSYGQPRLNAGILSDSSFMTSDHVKLFLTSAGKGTSCIFVHGGPGAWSKSFEVMGGNVLEKKLTMWYYDQRGSGRSESPENGDYSLNRMVQDIEDIRIATGKKKIYLLAHSFGGILAFNYALKYPEYVKGLILLNATLSINHSLANQIIYVNKTLGTNFGSNAAEDTLTAYVKAITALRKSGNGYMMLSHNEVNVAMLDSVDNSTRRNYDFGRLALGMKEYFTDFSLATGRLNVPVLVISGTADNNIGPEHYKRFSFPKQTVKEIVGGHMLYYEKNKAFEEAVFEFVR